MHKLFLALILVLVAGFCLAQPNRERIEAARIGLITNRLSLTPEESTKFWPVYNEYNEKKMNLRRSLRKLRMDTAPSTATDDQIRQNLKEMITIRQQEVDLEKEYLNKFLKVITPRQVADLFKAEQEFTRLMVERLEQRRSSRQPR